MSPGLRGQQPVPKDMGATAPWWVFDPAWTGGSALGDTGLWAEAWTASPWSDACSGVRSTNRGSHWHLNLFT